MNGYETSQKRQSYEIMQNTLKHFL